MCYKSRYASCVHVAKFIIFICHITMTTTFPKTKEGICPTVAPCVCQDDMSLSCAYQSLEELPDFLEFTEIWNELDLSENLLLVLHSHGFKGVKVKSLRLERNMIHHMEEASFNGLSMLESLYLSHNRLATIHPRIFEPLSRLRTLRLQYNGLSVLGELSVSGLSGLYELDLTGNSFRSVPAASLCKITNLKKLILRHNLIHELPPYVLYGLSLDYLDIGANKAPMIIHRDAFCGLDPQGHSSEPGVIDWTGLSTLRLDLNGLTTISSCLTQRIWTLSSLDISGNPLQCDCSLLLLKDNGVKTDYTGAQCDSPAQYAGKYLEDIRPDSYHCSTHGLDAAKLCQTSTCRSNKSQHRNCDSSGNASMLCLSSLLSIYVTFVKVSL